MQLFVYEIDKYFTYDMFVHVINNENYRQNFTLHTLANTFLLLVNISLLVCVYMWFILEKQERSTEKNMKNKFYSTLKMSS